MPRIEATYRCLWQIRGELIGKALPETRNNGQLTNAGKRKRLTDRNPFCRDTITAVGIGILRVLRELG